MGGTTTRILTSSYYLDLSGVPTYTRTMKEEFERRGHEVFVYSPMGGEMAVELGAIDGLSNLAKPDVIIAHANTCAEQMRERFPTAPMIFSAHGVLPLHEQPPRYEVEAYTAINEDVAENLIHKGVYVGNMTIVRDFVNTGKFRPYTTPDESLRNVLFISNFRKGETYPIIVRACEEAHVHLRAIGAPYGRSRHVEEEINKADLVISTGRGIIEAMSCGRPVISYGQGRGDGYLKPDVYMRSRTRNFAGEKCDYVFDAHQLSREFGHYCRTDGDVNRMMVLNYHSHTRGVDQLLEIVYKIV